MKQIVCPISNDQINERLTRLNAFFVIILTVAAIISQSPVFMLFLLVDFYMRAFTKSKLSPISMTSKLIADVLRLSEKAIDKAPKIFAARLGFLMTLVITFLFFMQLNTAAIIISGILVFFATLEFLLGICVGCIIYTYFILPFYK
jgi:hypothetical protein